MPLTSEQRARKAAWERTRQQDPKIRERRNGQARERRKTPEHRRYNREYLKVYRTKPENRARWKEYARKQSAKNRLNPDYLAKRRTSENAKNEAERIFLAGRPRPDTCEVCGRHGKIEFDHCHKNGHFRGWLCNKCNVVLGLCADAPEILLKLSAYLKRTKTNTSPQLALPGI